MKISQFWVIKNKNETISKSIKWSFTKKNTHEGGCLWVWPYLWADTGAVTHPRWGHWMWPHGRADNRERRAQAVHRWAQSTDGRMQGPRVTQSGRAQQGRMHPPVGRGWAERGGRHRSGVCGWERKTLGKWSLLTLHIGLRFLVYNSQILLRWKERNRLKRWLTLHLPFTAPLWLFIIQCLWGLRMHYETRERERDKVNSLKDAFWLGSRLSFPSSAQFRSVLFPRTIRRSLICLEPVRHAVSRHPKTMRVYMSILHGWQGHISCVHDCLLSLSLTLHLSPCTWLSFT